MNFRWDGGEIELPVLEGTNGDRAIDVGQLRSQTGLTTFDPGFANTASCTSAITFIDGERGVLRYRGYPIESLALTRRFTEVAYLMLRGSLPSSGELDEFELELSALGSPPDELCTWLRSLSKQADSMAVLAAAIAVLPAYEPVKGPEEAAMQLMAYTKGIIGTWFRHCRDEAPVRSVPEFRWSADLLNMMFYSDEGGGRTQAVFDDTLNLVLLLHADHEQNCSTAVARMVASAEASTHASISAAVGALSGPRHGGANRAVIEMLEALRAEGGDVRGLLASVRAGERKLMGFGHRVYKHQDPRAVLLERAARELLAKLPHQDPLLQLANDLERAALDDDYFRERRLFANVDFYSGIVYRALGVPTDMYTMMFALGRLPGWLAQLAELRSENYRIQRPRQLYVGPTERRPPANSLLDEV